jgi:hypothetical protein
MAGRVRVLDRDGNLYTEGEFAESWHLARLRWPFCRLSLLRVEGDEDRLIVKDRRIVGRWQVVTSTQR